jgi:hypothetical protein
VTPVSRDSDAGRAYLALQAQAREQSRPTEELLQLYALEGFLTRLAVSDYVGKLVLKGGVLLAAFGNRRPTKDVDLAALDMSNDAADILEVMQTVAALDPPTADGLVYDVAGASAEAIRDDDAYAGVRVSMGVQLATARMRFHIDVNVGDPVWPGPEQVQMPRLLGGDDLELIGYPLHMVHAEKIVTAVQRGVANTRWRDFGDVWTLSGRHSIDGGDLQTAIREVAAHRRATLDLTRTVLDGYPEIAQAKWSAWRRKHRLEQLPEKFAVLMEDYYNFVDPPLQGDVSGKAWVPGERAWH